MKYKTALVAVMSFFMGVSNLNVIPAEETEAVSMSESSNISGDNETEEDKDTIVSGSALKAEETNETDEADDKKEATKTGEDETEEARDIKIRTMAKNNGDISYQAEGGNIYFESTFYYDYDDGSRKDVLGLVGCDEGVTRADIPDEVDGMAVASIYSNAFEGCKDISAVSIGKNVNNIYEGAFSYCDSLESITVSAENESYEVIDGALFRKNPYDTSKNLICYPQGRKDTYYAIPDSTGYIYIVDSAFAGCKNLEEIYLSENVSNLEGAPFSGCERLKNIKVNENNSNYKDIDGVLYSSVFNWETVRHEIKVLKHYPQGRDENEYSIPDGMSDISDGAFENATRLVTVNIPNSVNYIYGNAFYGCSSLKNIKLDSVDNIGDGAFYGCVSLSNVKLSDSLEKLGNEVFYGCTSLTEITIPDSVEEIGDSIFAECKNLKTIKLPTEITEIPNSSFRNTALENVDIPTGVMYIGLEAFRGCKQLKSVTIPSSVTGIASNSFSGCTKDTVFRVEKNSYAESWALKNKFNVEYTGTAEIPTEEPADNIEYRTRPYLIDNCLFLENGNIKYIDTSFIGNYFDINSPDTEFIDFANGYFIDKKGYLYDFIYNYEESNNKSVITGYLFKKHGEYRYDDVNDKYYTDYDFFKGIKKFCLMAHNGNAAAFLTRSGELKSLSGYVRQTGVKDFSYCEFGGAGGSMSLMSDGKLYLGNTQIAENIEVKKIDDSLILSDDGTVYEVKSDEKGEVSINAVLSDVDDVYMAANDNFDAYSGINYIALKKDGTVWMKGDNNIGQLGIGTYGEENASNVYVQVPNLSDIVSISCDVYPYQTMYALEKDGDLWTWGGKEKNAIPVCLLNIYDSGSVKGDVNGDNEVTTKDAVLALQMSTGKREKNMNADVNGDGDVTTKDAVLILRYSTGKIKDFQ